MNAHRLCVATLTVPLLALGARAQLIGPIPPAPPPTPEYVPEKAAHAPEPVESAPLAPSIVRRDAENHLVALPNGPEAAAVVAYPFPDVQRTRIAKSTAQRQLDLDRFVVAHVDAVQAARSMRPTVESASDFDTLFKARDTVAALKFDRLIDRLERDQAITMQQRLRLEEALRDYDKARKQEIEQATGGDPTRAAVLNLRQTFADATREPFESLARQVDDVAATWSQTMEKARLNDAQKSELRPVIATIGGKERIAADGIEWFRSEFGKLSPELQRTLLTARLATRADADALR
jgi:hypothetical protein